MGVCSDLFFAVRLSVLGLVLVSSAGAATDERPGYYVVAKITRIDAEGKIDFWPISVRALPRRSPADTDAEPAELPKVIATLELKSRSAVARVRISDLRGQKIAVRGKCEDLDRATRIPVLQVQLGTGQRWQQANLEPVNRVGHTGFKRIAARVCGSGAESDPAPAAAGDGGD